MSDSTVPTSEHPHRTAFHFQPSRNWMNDPNGPMYFNGVYHLFYQYNPSGALFTRQMHWGHSASHDLINWIPLDLTFAPDEPFDKNSCWSGSATILPGNKPVMFYTGIDSQKRQVQNLAVPKDVSDPYLREWIKYKGNPVIDLPDKVQPHNFRDPTTAWLAEDGKWRVIVGGEIDRTGIAFQYKSEDFFSWTKIDWPLYEAAGTKVWECLDFFPVWIVGKEAGVETSVINPSVKHVMKMGLVDHGKDYYLIGNYNPGQEKFVPEKELTPVSSMRFDYGKYYASKSFFDPVKSRRILIAWVTESDSNADIEAKGWAGLQSFPRSLWLAQNQKQLIQWPIEEIEMLRENQVSVQNKKLECGSLHQVEGITADQADVKISFKLSNLEEAEELDPSWIDNPQLIWNQKDPSKNGKVGPFGLLALASKDFTEQTAIFFRVFKNKGRYVVLMCSDQSRSSEKDIGIDKSSYAAFVDIDPEKDEISLRTLIDHSIVESFGGGGKTCITARAHPISAIGKEARLFAFNNGTQAVTILELSAWSLKKALINVEKTTTATEDPYIYI